MEEIPTSESDAGCSLPDMMCAAEKSGFPPIAMVKDEGREGRVFIVCEEGQVPCPLELVQLRMDWSSLITAASSNPMFLGRIRMLQKFL